MALAPVAPNALRPTAVTLRSAVEAHGRVHTVVVAAGSNIGQRFLAETSEEQWSEVIENDLNGFFRIAKKAIPHMREMGGGISRLQSRGLRDRADDRRGRWLRCVGRENYEFR